MSKAADLVAEPLQGFTDQGVAKRYQQFVEDNHGDVTDIPRLCEIMANFGGRRMLQAMTVTSDVIPQLSRIEQRIVQLRALIQSMDGA